MGSGIRLQSSQRATGKLNCFFDSCLSSSKTRLPEQILEFSFYFNGFKERDDVDNLKQVEHLGKLPATPPINYSKLVVKGFSRVGCIGKRHHLSEFM